MATLFFAPIFHRCFFYALILEVKNGLQWIFD
nr:MAG TPA: hypothetical protein [Caudoviricetes sp.]